MRHLDLFSGIGGFALAARNVGWETVGFCDIDPYCQKVLRKHWPDVPIYEDIKTYDGQECDILTGGFPCQPYSQAGKQAGAEDNRDLWPEMYRVIKSVRPTWVVAENVVGIVKLALDNVLADVEDAGYAWSTYIIPAAALNAPHRRDRVWIVAHTERNKQSREKPRCGSPRRVGRVQQPVAWNRDWQDALTEFRGMDDGLSGRVVRDRTDALRNAIVPQVAEVIFRAINEIEKSPSGEGQ